MPNTLHIRVQFDAIAYFSGMATQEWICNSPNELSHIAQDLLASFPQNRVFVFEGEMGAGKTTFISALVRALGSTDTAASPTYGLVNEYHDATGNPIYHFDFYRLKSTEEAFESGADELLHSGCYCFAEWPSRVPGLFPDAYVQVNITVLAEQRILRALLHA